jgi:hypothetical protein
MNVSIPITASVTAIDSLFVFITLLLFVRGVKTIENQMFCMPLIDSLLRRKTGESLTDKCRFDVEGAVAMRSTQNRRGSGTRQSDAAEGTARRTASDGSDPLRML